MDGEVRSEAQKILDGMGSQDRIVLYAIGAGGVPMETLVRLQKVIFLSSKSLPDILGDVFIFEHHKKGPFCEDVSEICRDMISGGMVRGSDVSLTDLGTDVFDMISRRIREPLSGDVNFWKEFVSGLSEDELLTFVYVNYPDEIVNSDVWDRLKGDIRKNTVSLVRKGKITAGKGAEMVGMRYLDFEEVLRKSSVRWKS